MDKVNRTMREKGMKETPITLTPARFAQAVTSLLLVLFSSSPLAQPLDTHGDDLWNCGPLVDRFSLTLTSGQRTEVLGPFYYYEAQPEQTTWAVPPLFSSSRNPGLETREYDFLYPLLTYDRFGDQYRWQLIQLLSFAGGPTQTETNRDRFTVFPFYFQQRSSDPGENYTALFPIYGNLKHRLMRDEIHFVLFPAYSRTKKRDVVTHNYLYPVFHRRSGDGLTGWQVWPLMGHEVKRETTRTNDFGETEKVGGHERWMALWPIFSEQRLGSGTTNPVWHQALLPAYYLSRSPARDQTTVLWPFFSRIEDREKKYVEWQTPWPIVAVARGEGKTMTRVWPLFSRSQSEVISSETYLWPLYRHKRVQADPLDRERTRILYFLFSDVNEKNTETGRSREWQALWPFYFHRQEADGSRRLQVLALLEPILANNENIERNYSPLWALWRSEHRPETGRSSQSLLWNLYRRETSPEEKKWSALFGLFQYRSGTQGKRVRLFFLPFSGPRKTAEGAPPAGAPARSEN
jgi:hypothetical protein